jgi:hypothetical protein
MHPRSKDGVFRVGLPPSSYDLPDVFLCVGGNAHDAGRYGAHPAKGNPLRQLGYRYHPEGYLDGLMGCNGPFNVCPF